MRYYSLLHGLRKLCLISENAGKTAAVVVMVVTGGGWGGGGGGDGDGGTG